MYRSSWVFLLLHRHPGWNPKGKWELYMSWASPSSLETASLLCHGGRKKTKIVCISCYGHSRSTDANTPPFSGTAKSHSYAYMYHKFCYQIAESDKKWGLITLMIFSAVPDYKKCVYKNAFHTSPFSSPTSHKLLLVYQKTTNISSLCLRLPLSFKITWKSSHVSGLALENGVCHGHVLGR